MGKSVMRRRLLGASVLEQLHAYLDSVLQDWQAGWLSDATANQQVELVVDAMNFSSKKIDEDVSWRRYDGQEGRVSIGMHREIWPLVGAELLGHPNAQSDVSARVGRLAIGDLAMRILGRKAGLESANEEIGEDSLLPEDYRAGAGNIHACAKVGRIELRFLLDKELVSHIAPRLISEPIRLVSAASCIGSQTVATGAWLDLGRINLRELIELEVGDVLVMDAKLDNALSLSLPSGKPIAMGHMAQSDGRRALVLSSNT